MYPCAYKVISLNSDLGLESSLTKLAPPVPTTNDIGAFGLEYMLFASEYCTQPFVRPIP